MLLQISARHAPNWCRGLGRNWFRPGQVTEVVFPEPGEFQEEQPRTLRLGPLVIRVRNW